MISIYFIQQDDQRNVRLKWEGVAVPQVGHEVRPPYTISDWAWEVIHVVWTSDRSVEVFYRVKPSPQDG